jgi:hypothetical protein
LRILYSCFYLCLLIFIFQSTSTNHQPLQEIKNILDYSSSQEDSGAFGEVDIPKEQKLKERQENAEEVLGWSYRPKDKERKINRRKVLELYTKLTRRPIYSLQILCLIAISRNNHPEEQIYTLDYTFKDPERIIKIQDPYPRPIGFNLHPYTELQLEKYIKPRYQAWVKAGGYRLYLERKGWLEDPFYIDLWKVIEGKENRLLVTDTSVIQNVCQQETNQEPGTNAS